MNTSSQIVQKLWSYCHVLRDDGLSYGDYVELHGVEIVDSVARLCAMNLLLHGIGPNADEAKPPIATKDSLGADPGERYDVILTNPPFGK